MNIRNLFAQQQVKVALIVIFSFVAVRVAAPQVFLANTPRVNPLFIARIRNAPKDMAAMPGRIMASLRSAFTRKTPQQTGNNVVIPTPVTLPFAQAVPQNAIVTPPTNVLFQPIKTGVYAATDTTTQTSYVKIDPNTTVKIMEVKLPDGRIIKIIPDK